VLDGGKDSCVSHKRMMGSPNVKAL